MFTAPVRTSLFAVVAALLPAGLCVLPAAPPAAAAAMAAPASTATAPHDEVQPHAVRANTRFDTQGAVWVANQGNGDGSIVELDPTSGRIINYATGLTSPNGIAVTSNGGTVFEAGPSPDLGVFNVCTLSGTASAAIGDHDTAVSSLAMSPDGSTVYADNWGDGILAALDTSGHLKWSTALSTPPATPAVDLSGQILVPTFGSGAAEFDVINPNGQSFTDGFGAPAGEAYLAQKIATNPVTGDFYVEVQDITTLSGHDTGRLFQYTSSGTYLNQTTLPASGPADMEVSPNGQQLYLTFNPGVSVPGISALDVLDAGSLSQVAYNSSFGARPTDIAFSPGGYTAYVSDGGVRFADGDNAILVTGPDAVVQTAWDAGGTLPTQVAVASQGNGCPAASPGATGSGGSVAGGGSFIGIASTPDGKGYWLATSKGKVEAFGDAVWFGDASSLTLNKGIVSIAPTPDGGGYWLLGGDGGVFGYGDAKFYGSTGNIRLNQPALGMAAAPDGRGYWFVASDGGIFAYGSARFYGSMGGRPLNQPVMGMALDPATGGYWLVASDGGIFSFNAPFRGSTGSLRLAQPVVGMAAASDGSGYRFVAADGGVFCFHETFAGSLAGSGRTITSMAPYGTSGYWLLADDGQVAGFGGAPVFGNGS